MSNADDRDEQRLMELLAGKALGNLSDREEAELAHDDADESQHALLSNLEATAAAVQLAFEADLLELPRPLRDRIRQQWDDQRRAGLPQPLGDATKLTTAERHRGAPRFSSRELFAWMVCAASVIMALGLWNSDRTPKPIALVQARSQLQAQPGTIIAQWTQGPTPVPGEVSGDVVWNTEQQQGYLRFVGMPINDPTVEQYQLWIIDPGRDSEPVDGGVFDILSSGEVIIPIDAKLRVVRPQTFAVTIEQPGGVVVSTQDRLPLLASLN